jgi:FAD-dependent oxidoreductase domain-containing protein 1
MLISLLLIKSFFILKIIGNFARVELRITGGIMQDLIIVGGGIIGGAALYHLFEIGYRGKVLVLERNDALAQESTSLCAGGMRNIWSTEVNMKMTSYSIEHFKNFKKNFGISIGFEQNGYLFTYYENNWKNIVDFKPIWDKAGVNVELIPPEEIEKIVPAFRPGISHIKSDILDVVPVSPIVGGLFGKDCAIFNATTPAQTYFSVTKERYPNLVEIKLNKEVERIIVDKGKAEGVITKDGEEISSGAVLLTAGAWSRQVLDNSGVPDDLSIPVVPIKRVLYVILSPKNGKDYSKVPLTIIDNGVYFRPEGNRLVTGRADEKQKAGFDKEPSRSYYEDFMNLYLQIRIPGAEYCRIRNMWGGLYEVNTEDHNALIGEHPDFEDLFICTGFSGHGAMEAPAAGISIAEIIESGKVKTIPEVGLLNIERIRDRKLIKETIVL